MDELIIKVNNLIDTINNSDIVREVKKYNDKVMSDESLLKLLEEYNNTKDEKIKEKIISNELFREYKLKETDLNIMIMSINQKLKTISKERSCNKWK